MNITEDLQANKITHTFTDTSLLPKNLICLSHLRWDFVYQRPQHLLSRLSKAFTVYFVEEPVFTDEQKPAYHTTKKEDNLYTLVPHLPHGTNAEDAIKLQQNLLDNFLSEEKIDIYGLWYYTPMALKFSKQLKPAFTVFDCMDELSAFKFAPQELKDLEKELLKKADVVFTGGNSLYNAKKDKHNNIHSFPSSIDKNHFAKARVNKDEPSDQKSIPSPRFGFYGVIDERFDIKLIEEVAARRPEWQIILIGPVVKIDTATLPQKDNIHYLGGKSYSELPQYLAGWDVAMIPFAINESTEFISPTKTPEYLAGGVPVISTPIRDVIYPYGENKLVHIAADANEFINAAETILHKESADSKWLEKTDKFLENISWDNTVAGMLNEIKAVVKNNTKKEN